MKIYVLAVAEEGETDVDTKKDVVYSMVARLAAEFEGRLRDAHREEERMRRILARRKELHNAHSDAPHTDAPHTDAPHTDASRVQAAVEKQKEAWGKQQLPASLRMGDNLTLADGRPALFLGLVGATGKAVVQTASPGVELVPVGDLVQ